MAAMISGCSGKGATGETSDGNIFEEAVFIKGIPQAEGAMAVTVVNPWDSTGVLARYMLLNPWAADSAATQAIRLALPLKRLVVYSAVHAALLAELGYADAIVGVADAGYIKTPEIAARLADGRIADIGSSMEPSLEKIISLHPDGILISPFQNAGHGVVDKAGVPVIECADYM